MAWLLKGDEVARELNAKTRERTEGLKEKGIHPVLGILRIGERSEDISYEQSAVKRCNSLGIAVERQILAPDVSQDELMETIHTMNCDNQIHGILLLRPLPRHLEEWAACRAVLPEKDVDGVTDISMAGVFMGRKQGFPPCTPAACMELLDYYGIDCTGKRAVVIGRSLVAGKPAALMLLDRNATVTVCHTKTADLPEICREADLLIAAAGHTEMVTEEYLRSGQIILDVGIHVKEGGKICGDVRFEAAEPVVGAITPVPGGIGTITASVLAAHVAEAAQRLG